MDKMKHTTTGRGSRGPRPPQRAGAKASGRSAGFALRAFAFLPVASLPVALLAFLGLRAQALAAPGVSVVTRSYDLGRTGWNRAEPTLTPANVTPQTFHKVAEIRVDDKIESSPLYAAGVTTAAGTRDLLIVTTTRATVHAFDATTHALVWKKSLGTPIEGYKAALYDKWGITATPVIDPDSGTLYVLRWGMEGPNPIYRLFGLRLGDGSEAIHSQVVDGFSVKRNGKFFRNGFQLVRTALALWRNGAGDKAVVFGASGGENINDANGWIIAYNVAALQAGGNVTPAVWCSTPTAGGAGIWMASQGVAVDESDPHRDIYFSTGNGPYKPVFGADNLGESVVRLRFDPGANTLNVVDWFTPFEDAAHDPNHRDQDLGAAGVLLVPNALSVLAGGKEGIFYNVNRNAMGKLSHASLLQPDLVATFVQAPGFTYLANTNQATTTDGVTGSNGGDRTFLPHPADGGRTRHVHGGPAYYEHLGQRFIYVMGENSTLRAFSYNGTALSFVAESPGLTKASGETPSPGGMPGGFLSISSRDAQGHDGIVWSLSPRKSNWRDPAANEIPGPSILRAFDAVPAGGVVNELWNSEMEVTDAPGTASKFQPPLVANGRVYVVTYNNRVVVYGTTPPKHKARDVRRTMVLIKAHLEPGQDLFLRGGIDRTFGNAHGRNCPASSAPNFDDPTYFNCAVRIEHRNTLNYGANHEPYAITNRWSVNDTYLDWYGPEEFQTFERRGPTYNDLGVARGTPLDWTTSNAASGFFVARHGFGLLKETKDAALGDDIWMLDVDMDCGTAVDMGGTAWFELKSVVSNVPNGGFEGTIKQADRPWVSGNHFAKCGKINIFERGKNTVTYRDFDTANQCSLPDQERRCDGSHAQVCKAVGATKVWQDVADCVQSFQLCQPSTGQCCTPTNGNASNHNCL